VAERLPLPEARHACRGLSAFGGSPPRISGLAFGLALVVIEESVLRNVIGGAEVMAGQLGHLITVASLPSVWLSIVPMGLQRDAVWSAISSNGDVFTITTPDELGRKIRAHWQARL
jgi:Domain of unknown function (DUF5753)